MADNLQQELKISERILEIRKQIAAYENQEEELTEKQQAELLKLEASLAKILKFQEKRQKASYGTTLQELELNKTYSSQLSSLSSISRVYKGLTDIQSNSLNISRSILSSVEQALLSDETKRDVLNSTLTGISQLQGLQQKLAETGPEDLEQQVAIRAEYQAQVEQLKQVILTKKAIGEITKEEATALLKTLDTQKESFSIAEKYATQSSMTKDIIQKQLDVYEGIEKTIRGTLNTAKVLTSTVGGALGTGLLGASAGMKKLLSNSRQLGASMFSTANITTSVFSLAFDNAADTAKSLSKELGGMNESSTELQYNANLISKNYAISSDETGKLVSNLMIANGNSEELAMNTLQAAENFATTNGIPLDVFMGDVAGASKEFALFGNDGGQNLIKAVGAARKLGVEMSTISGIADEILDFESSMTKELELSAMLGRNINLNAARQAALQDDLGGMVRETLKAVGGIEAFNKMDRYSKQQVANTLGIQVDELKKMAQNADKLNELGEVQQTQWETTTQSAKAFGDYGLKGLDTLASMAIVSGQMGMSWKGIGGSITNFVKGTAASLKNLTQNLLGTDALSKARKNLTDKQIASGFGGKKAKDMLASKTPTSTPSMTPKTPTSTPSMTPKTPASAPSPAQKINNTTSGRGGMNVGNMLKGAAAILILSAALFVAAKAFQEFANVTWESVTMGLVGLAGMATIAVILGKVQGEMIKGALAVAILGAALIPFAFSMSLIAGLDIKGVLAAAAGLVIFSAAIFGLGALMMTGAGAFIFGAGLVAIVGLGVAMMVLGSGLTVVSSAMERFVSSLSSIGPLISELGTSLSGMVGLAGSILLFAGSLAVLGYSLIALGLSTLIAAPGLLIFGLLATSLLLVSNALTNIMGSVSGIGNIVGQLTPLTSMITPIFALAGAITALGLSLAFLGTTGLVGLAVLAGVAALAEPISMIADVLGIGGERTSGETGAIERGSLSEYETTMLQKMDELIAVTKKYKDVYMDAEKVTNVVMAQAERKTQNIFGLGVA